jgi:hydroxymethylbilane synthase
MAKVIRIGTRQSPLALWQAEFVSQQLQHLGHQVELVKIVTTGDTTSTPLAQAGGVGLFTKEIQRALLDNRCDVAVHSLKDLPTDPIAGLTLCAVPKREIPWDCLIGRHPTTLAELPSGAVVGTGSPRRRAQLLHSRPDLIVQDIRGNLDTRLKKLDSGQFDAILLAFAGLHRLGLQERISETLTLQQMVPAVGQGALGLETRQDDPETQQAIFQLNDWPSHAAVLFEREILRSLRAGCMAPVAVHAVCGESSFSITYRVFLPTCPSSLRRNMILQHSILRMRPGKSPFAWPSK